MSMWNFAVNAIYGPSVDESDNIAPDNNDGRDENQPRTELSIQNVHSNANSDDPTMKGLFFIIENQKKSLETQSITIQKQSKQIQNQTSVQSLIRVLQNKNSALNDTISELKEGSLALNKVQIQLKEACVKNKSTMKELNLVKMERNNLKIFKTERNNLKQRIQSLHASLKELQNNFDASIDNDNSQHNLIQDTKGANIDCVDSENMIRTIQNNMNDLKNKNNFLKEYICRLEEGRSQNTDLENKYNKLQRELNTAQNRNAILNDNLKVCRCSVSELRNTITALKRESIETADAMNQILKATEEDKLKAQIECDYIRTQLKVEKVRGKTLGVELTQIKLNLNAVDENISYERFDKMKRKLKSTEVAKRGVETKCATLEAKVSKLIVFGNNLQNKLTNKKAVQYSWYQVKKDKFIEVNQLLAQRLDILKVGHSFEYKRKGKLSKSKFIKSLADLVREKCSFGSDNVIVRRRTFIVLQWEWKDNDGTFKPYPLKLRKEITHARNGSVFHYKTNRFEYEIKKISNCKAEQRNTATNKMREVRSNQIDSDRIDICSSSQYYSQCILMTTTFVNSLFYETLGGLKCKIDSIEEVMDKSKNLHYELLLKDKCNKYMQSRDQIEQILWHGSTFEGLQCIIKSGFDRSYNVRGRFGRGSYFAKRCHYSIKNGYCVEQNGYYYILLCKVICGKYMVGNSKMHKIPKQNNGEEYDALVDCTKDQTIFVSWRDYMSLPLYLIKFTMQ